MHLPQQQLAQLDPACLIGTEGGALFRCNLDLSPASLDAFAQACTLQQPVWPGCLEYIDLASRVEEVPSKLGCTHDPRS